eukprot:360760-Chlamydomonas_euryale.AAC.2
MSSFVTGVKAGLTNAPRDSRGLIELLCHRGQSRADKRAERFERALQKAFGAFAPSGREALAELVQTPTLSLHAVAACCH